MLSKISGIKYVAINRFKLKLLQIPSILVVKHMVIDAKQLTVMIDPYIRLQILFGLVRKQQLKANCLTPEMQRRIHSYTDMVLKLSEVLYSRAVISNLSHSSEMVCTLYFGCSLPQGLISRAIDHRLARVTDR